MVDGVLGFDEIEARLIEAMRVFAFGMRGGPVFATDGPWAQVRLDWVDRYAHGGESKDGQGGDVAKIVAQALRAPRPDRAMIARAEEAGAWLGLIGSEVDRRIVIGAVDQLASGRARVDWGWLVRRDGKLGGRREWARVRYARALRALAATVSGRARRGVHAV
jgi:hypothetical protein